MTVRTITVTIPEMLYLHLEAAAHASDQSLDAVVAQSLERIIPPHLATLLPSTLQAELGAMEHLSDEVLRVISMSVQLPERSQQIADLITLRENGTISAEQESQLIALRVETEALMVRKAHAFVLLKSRGYTPPSIDQLPVPPA